MQPDGKRDYSISAVRYADGYFDAAPEFPRLEKDLGAAFYRAMKGRDAFARPRAAENLEDCFPQGDYKIIKGRVIHRSGMSYGILEVERAKLNLKKSMPHLSESQLNLKAIEEIERPWWPY